MVALTGDADGKSQVDYTVNPATGFPSVTGPRTLDEPVNSVLPAWDIALGTLAAFAVLAADRHRAATGEGGLAHIALSDVAVAMVGNLGRLAQAELGGVATKDGNHLFGAFGHDFETRDGRRVMVVALTDRQWSALCQATGIGVACEEIEEATGHDLSTQGGRAAHGEKKRRSKRSRNQPRTLWHPGQVHRARAGCHHQKQPPRGALGFTLPRLWRNREFNP